MKTNVKIKSAPIYTHEGARAVKINAEQELKRSVLATFLWEDGFYESGQEISQRIASLIPQVKAEKVAELAIRARNEFKLRHIPLFIAREMVRHDSHKHLVAHVLENIIQRADELAELLSIYWKEGRTPIANQIKKGLAKAFIRFSEYDLAKYNRDSAIKLRDVLFLVHARPLSKEQDDLWKRLINDKLETPYTWETELSASKGENKKEVWENLLNKKALGGLAFLRNLRNMREAGVNKQLIRDYFQIANFSKVLPFRFIAAAKYAPDLEPELETAMIKAVESKEKIGGNTVLLIDVSGSMDGKLSAKSENTRLETACALAILAREVFQNVEVYTFSNNLAQVPTRRGFALRDAIVKSQPHGGTNLGNSLNQLHTQTKYDRLIVFTDEQSSNKPDKPNGLGYVINVANNKNGIGYGNWTHIDGFSEAVITYIQEWEKFNRG
jgi:hypothetical protein